VGTSGDSEYEVYALRYGGHAGHRAGLFLQHDLSGEPDGPQQVDYFFWLLRNAHRTVLVDCGFVRDRGVSKQRYQDTHPLELLARMGTRAEDVDNVVISHAHYDHMGNVGLFPHATFSMARREFEFATGRYADRFPTRCFVDPVDVAAVRDLARQERLTLLDDAADLFPGIAATPVGGHTPGQMLTEVTTASGQIVLASDAAHFYEELECDRPFNIFHDLDGMFRTYDRLRELGERPGTTVVAGHDQEVMSRFLLVEPECVDLTAPVA